MTQERLTNADLEGVKLVGEENFAPIEDVQVDLERAFTQGSQGWGVIREHAVINTLARDLLDALAEAATADENFRMLKGAQMEGGRLKKKVDKLEAENLAYDLRIKELEAEVEHRVDETNRLEDALDDVRAQRQELAEILNEYTERAALDAHE